MQLNKLYNEDCIDGMKKIESKSIDLILTDLPYGVTDCAWDSVIPFPSLWECYNRIIKDNGAIVLFSVQPFTTKLINSNLKNFRYCWYWKKNNKTGFAFAKYQPLRCIEDICVFYAADTGNAGECVELRKYMFEELKKSGLTRGDVDKLLNNYMSSHYFTNGKQFIIPSKKDYEKLQSTGYFQRPHEDLKQEFAAQRKNKTTKYNPQGLKAFNKVINKHGTGSVYKISHKPHFRKYKNYPVNLLEFKNEAVNSKNRFHPTQKPLALCEYLIKTYTDAGDTVLDSCAGSGTTLLAAKNTGRNYIGFEIDTGYYKTALQRLMV